MRRMNFAPTAAGLALLLCATSAWAPPPVFRPPPPPVRPVPAPPRFTPPPVTRQPATRPPLLFVRPPTLGMNAALHVTLENARRRSADEAAKLLREEGAVALSRAERAAFLNSVAHQLLRQQSQEQANTEQRLAALAQLRADWAAVGPGVGLDPLVELELAAAEAAAERLALGNALTAIAAKSYSTALTELQRLTASRHLSVPIVEALPGLVDDLNRLVVAESLNPNGRLPNSNTPGLSPDAKKAISRVEAVLAVAELVTEAAPPVPTKVWFLPEVNQRLVTIATEFGEETAGKLRVELAAVAYLDGRTTDAITLLEGNVDAEHARTVLADLRAIVLGKGTLKTVQIAIQLDKEMPPVIAPLVPAVHQEKWAMPKPPAMRETTLAKLERLARSEVAVARTTAVARLAVPVHAAADSIKTELALRANALVPFSEKVQARLGRPIEKAEEKELVAVVAGRGLTVDDAVALLAADADRPAQAARVLGAALTPMPVAHVAASASAPVSLKTGEAGGFTLSAREQARDRTKLRSAVRTGFDQFTRDDKLPPVTFAAAVHAALKLPDGEALTDGEFAQGLLDASRDAATEYSHLAAEKHTLENALMNIDERDFDAQDMAAIRAARERAKSLATATERPAKEVQFGCDRLSEHGTIAALTWLRQQTEAHIPWHIAAGEALTKITAKAKLPVPVPVDAKPKVGCILTFDAKKSPLDNKAFTLELKNNTDKDIEVLSTLPFGLLVFLDMEVEDPAGKRISEEFYNAKIASPFAPPPRLVATLAVDKPTKLEVSPFSCVEEKKREALKPGKYRVRVKFRYDKFTAVSEWVTVEIPERDK